MLHRVAPGVSVHIKQTFGVRRFCWAGLFLSLNSGKGYSEKDILPKMLLEVESLPAT